MSKFQDIVEKYAFQPFADYLVRKSEEGSLNKATTAVTGAKRYDVNLSDLNNSNRVKPNAAVPFQVLRRFSVSYDVARSCINVRKRQISQMDWKIVPVENDTTKDTTADATKIKNIMRGIGGYNLSFRNLSDMIIEDLMVLDAVSLEKRMTYGGEIYGLLPIDAATIKVRVDSSGRTPVPPEIAYKQIIRGAVTAEFTADEMYYGMLNPRTNTPYGLAPLETLVMTVNGALKSSLLNLEQMTEGNVPEGFYTVPKEWTGQQIKDFQEIFDAAIAGDGTANSRIRFMPEGTYTATRKIDDMRYKEFSEWLMKITCSVFDVQPIEIGFEPKTGLGGAGFSKGQDVITNRKAIIPLANFLKDIWDDVIQNELGYTDFEFRYEGLEYTDPKMEAEVNEILIRSGQSTVDEVRAQQQLEPLGVDKPFVMGNPTFIDAESQETRKAAANALISMGGSSQSDGSDTSNEPDDTQKPDSDTQKSAEDTHIQLVTELRAFRKYAINATQKNKRLRAFQSDVLPEATVNEMNKRLQKAKSLDKVKKVFDEYMQDYQVQFLADVLSLQHDIKKIL